MELKLIQCNIWHGRYHNKLVTFLREQDADIITLQEVTSFGLNWGENAQFDVFEQLKSDLNCSGIFAPTFLKRGERDGHLGNAILSKFPILYHKVHFLSGRLCYDEEFGEDWRREPRNLLEVRLDIGKSTLGVFTTHLAFSPDFVVSPLQWLQAKKLSAILRRSNKSPLILAGDLNALPGSSVIGLLERDFENVLCGKNLVTFAKHRFAFGDFEVDELRYLIDYIFVNEAIHSIDINAIDVDCSDHLPLVYQFRYP